MKIALKRCLALTKLSELSFPQTKVFDFSTFHGSLGATPLPCASANLGRTRIGTININQWWVDIDISTSRAATLFDHFDPPIANKKHFGGIIQGTTEARTNGQQAAAKGRHEILS